MLAILKMKGGNKMSSKDKKKKVLEGVKRASERSGFPTIPKKKKTIKKG